MNRIRRLQVYVLAFLAALGLSAAAFAQPAGETKVPLSAQQSVGLTIYNSDLALVRDTPSIGLAKGLRTLAF